MVKVTLQTTINSHPRSYTLEDNEEIYKDISVSRQLDVDIKDLSVFYYNIRKFFRLPLTQPEKDQLLTLTQYPKMISKIKRRKNINYEDLFGNSHYISDVKLVDGSKNVYNIKLESD